VLVGMDCVGGGKSGEEIEHKGDLRKLKEGEEPENLKKTEPMGRSQQRTTKNLEKKKRF